MLNPMLLSVHPTLPMRNKLLTLRYYVDQLEFDLVGEDIYSDYLMLKKDYVEVHFFLFEELEPLENYGQIYIRTDDIRTFYTHLVERGVAIHPNAPLKQRPWGQFEFALLDPDHNLITVGQPV